MEDFEFYNPTKIIFGKNSIDKIANELKKIQCKKVMILYLGDYLEKSGVIDKVTGILKNAGIEFITYSQLIPNPLVSTAERAAALAKNENVDFILAIGGGSVIDVAKAIGLCLAKDDLSLSNLILGRETATDTKPVGVILTLAGSGSESSNSMVLTVDKGMMKRTYSNDIIRPNFAVLDPTLTYTLPYRQMIAGGCDILMHTLDRYFSPSKDTMLIDKISEGLLISTMDAILQSSKNPYDYEARASLMWAGNLSHNGLTGTGKTPDWGPHRLEHELSGKFNVVHGEGLCAIWGSWARYVYSEHIERFVAFAVNVMKVENDYFHAELTALRGIEKMEEFFRSIKMPTSLRELGLEVTEADIEDMAKKCLFNSDTIGSFKKLNLKDIINIYENARGD